MSLEEIDEIKQLKARYFRFFDTKQWDKWRELFTEDCVYHGTSGGYPDRETFVAGCRTRLHPAATVHHGHTPEIQILSATTAKGIWPMFDRVEFPSVREHGHGVSLGFTGAGHYEEEYRKVDGDWKISMLRITRLWVHLFDEPSKPFHPEPLWSRGRDWIDS